MECNNDRIRGILDDCAKRFIAEPDEWFPDEENLLWGLIYSRLRQEVWKTASMGEQCMIIGSILKLTAALNYNQDHLKEQASRIKTEIEKRKMIQQIEKFVEET